MINKRNTVIVVGVTTLDAVFCEFLRLEDTSILHRTIHNVATTSRFQILQLTPNERLLCWFSGSKMFSKKESLKPCEIY